MQCRGVRERRYASSTSARARIGFESSVWRCLLARAGIVLPPCVSGSRRRSSRRSTAWRSPRRARESSSRAGTKWSSRRARASGARSRTSVRAGRRLDRVGQRRVGSLRAAPQGEGADRGRVSPAARGTDALHVPPHRGGRAPYRGARRLRHHRDRIRDRGDGPRGAALAGADERDCGPACPAGGCLPSREAEGWTGTAPRRRGGSRTGARARHRRRVVGYNAAVIALGFGAQVTILERRSTACGIWRRS